jgi:DNA-binding winged helix-turn-helix (wHTH) protein/TolB-like protein
MSENEQTFAYEFGEWVVEPHLNRIRRGGKEIQLEPRTLEVLRYLLDHPGEVVSIDELLDTVWAGRVVEPNAVHRNLNRIRQALGDDPREPTYIETISKRGYRAIAPVQRVEVSQPTDSNLVAALEAITPPFPAYEGDEPYVFVCYSHEDRQQVYRELIRLRDAGINVWYDEGISIGSEWTDDIANAIANCANFLYFVSPKAVASNYCLDEVQLARNENKSMVAVHLERTTLPRSLQLSIGRFQALMKYSMPEPEYARKLLVSLGLYVESTPILDSPRLWKRLLATAAAAVIFLGLVLFLARGPGVSVIFDDPLENSIKVAPFRDLSPSYGDGWIGATIEDGIRVAAPGSGLQVVGSPSNWNAGEARYILEGSVTRFADRIKVSAILITIDNGFQVWAEIYDREYKPEFGAQGEIIRLIVTALINQIDVVGTPTLIPTKPDGEETGALQGILDTERGFPEFPSFEEGGSDE